MAVFLHHNELTVEVFDDAAFTQSADSPTSYDKVIQVESDKQYSPNSQHAIKVYKDERIIKTAIILASGGATGVHEDTALIDQGNLIIRCCNKLFSLSLPDLNTNWVTEPDWATCFSIHKYQDTYITHGEMSIARIDNTGKILWSYGGADIFVCLHEGNPFEMHDDFIELTDFNGSKYRIDYNGETVNYEQSDYHKQEPVTVFLKPQKPWWKFW
jgi:alpha-tubulin suppressor-like RCC1 family protein